MKLLFATVLVALFGQSSVLLAQSAASDTDTIIRLEREWEAAILKKDQATIDRIVALDCVFVASNGELMTKAQADAEGKENNGTARQRFLTSRSASSEMSLWWWAAIRKAA